MTNTFIYLGASEYALRVLNEISVRFDSIPVCIIEKNLNEKSLKSIIDVVGHKIHPDKIFDSSALKEPSFLKYLRDIEPDLAISVHFSEILEKKFIDIPRYGAVNVHSSYLPYNRGNWPEIWSIIRNTPAGITLHYIDEGIDTGKIIDQERITILPEDTCETLAARTEIAGIELIIKNWQSMICGLSTAKEQNKKYPLNLSNHIELVSEIKLDATYTGRELINTLRALTIPKLLKGAFFTDPKTGEKIWMQVSFEREKTVIS